MEFSYLINADDIKEDVKTFTFSANNEEREALAKRYDVESVDALDVKAEVRRQSGFMIIVKGHYDAKLTQTCVVTLEPVQTQVSEDFEAFFTDRDDTVSFAKARHKHIQENQDPETSFLDENDDPEKVVNGKVDLGEAVAQYLSLDVPAYPHKEGVSFENVDENIQKSSKQDAPHRNNPFAALEALKSSDK